MTCIRVPRSYNASLKSCFFRWSVSAGLALSIIPGLALDAAEAQTARTEVRGVVSDPCPPPLVPPAELATWNHDLPPSAAVQAFIQEIQRRGKLDYANLCRYGADDAALTAKGDKPPVAVFLGDSITENWARMDSGFLAEHVFVGRGISGQVSAQTLLRFEQDVVDLRPRVVHIMIGTNDVAGNDGATTYEAIERNIVAMVSLARANGIAVVLATIPPAADFPWRKGMRPAPKIQHLNDWLRDYARRNGIAVADYHTALADAAGGFPTALSQDGVHPNLAGYKAMEPIALAAISAALMPRR
jgi:lysophospholipase L1-like esterase